MFSTSVEVEAAEWTQLKTMDTRNRQDVWSWKLLWTLKTNDAPCRIRSGWSLFNHTGKWVDNVLGFSCFKYSKEIHSIRRDLSFCQQGSRFWWEEPLDEQLEEDRLEEGRMNAWNDSWQHRHDWLIVFIEESGWLNGERVHEEACQVNGGSRKGGEW